MDRPEFGKQSRYIRDRPLWEQYVLSLGAVAAALAARWLLNPAIGERLPFITVFTALLPLVVLVRPGPFLAGALLSLLGTWYLFVPAKFSFRVEGPDAELQIGLFAVAIAGAAATAWLSHSAEVRARRVDAMLRAFVDDSPTGKWVTDPSGRILYANRAMAETLGRPLTQILGRTHAEVLPPELAELSAERIRAVRETGQPHVCVDELNPANGDGSRRVLEWRRFPFRTGDDGRLLVAGMAQDITERRTLEEALRTSEERLRAATRQGKVGLWEWEIASDRVTWTDSLYAIHGVRRGEFTPTLDGFAALVHPEDRESVTRAIESTLQLGAPYELTFRAVRPNGETVWLFTNAVLLRDGERPVRMLGATTDVTELKRAEEALREADRHKDEFLATLAHELRNPLEPIHSALFLLRRPASDEAHREQILDRIERQVHALVRLVDDLLEVSRIARGKIPLSREPVELAEVLHSAIETSTPLIETARHDLTVDLPEEPLPLEADPLRLTQVFSNLLNNAAKYTEPGGRIRVVAFREGQTAVVSVQDSGVGIPAEMLSGVFELFTQVDRTLSRSRGGMGIGLTLAKRLVELHGGTVEARSEGTGRGSEFLVRLPLRDTAGRPARDA